MCDSYTFLRISSSIFSHLTGDWKKSTENSGKPHVGIVAGNNFLDFLKTRSQKYIFLKKLQYFEIFQNKLMR